MSVRDINKVIIITSALDGSLYDNIRIENYDNDTIHKMIANIYDRSFERGDGFLLKFGYEPR